jgi:hypothetical protein
MSINPNVLDLLQWQYRQQYRQYQKTLQQRRAPRQNEDSQIGTALESGESLVKAGDLWSVFKPILDSSRFSHMVINGPPGSGKSSAAREVMHYAHLDDYKILYTSGIDVLESPMKLKLAAGDSEKVAIVYDDLSYALNTTKPRQTNVFKNFFAMQRHFFKAKVFNITIGHFSTSMPPLLKNADVWLYPHITSLELDFLSKQCRSKTVRARLDRCIGAIDGIQRMLRDTGPVMDFNLYGKQYNGFTWDKDGRIQLIVEHGVPKLYLSQNKFCQECEKIAFSPHMDMRDYQIQ